MYLQVNYFKTILSFNQKIFHSLPPNRSVSVSDQIQRFTKEQERNKLLSSTAPQTPESVLDTPAAASSPESRAEAKSKTPAKQKTQKAGREGKGEAKDTEDGGNARGKSGGSRKKARKNDAKPKNTQPEEPAVQPATAQSKLLLLDLNI